MADSSSLPTSAPATTAEADTSPRAPQRVRHELRRRTLTVLRTERLTPQCIRVTLTGPELEGFYSPGFDDHLKLILPDATTGVLHLPSFGAAGVEADPNAPRPAMRDYTPRHYDAAAQTLSIDFALHNAGPATAWALQAAPGQQVAIGGPRGSMLIPMAFDGYVLIGDDTALPAIARRLAELPAGAPVCTVIEVDSPADEQPLPTAAAAQVHWIHRNGRPAGEADALLAAARALALPAGDLHVWVACEAQVAKALRTHWVGERGMNPAWTKAAAYWRRGAEATHEVIAD